MTPLERIASLCTCGRSGEHDIECNTLHPFDPLTPWVFVVARHELALDYLWGQAEVAEALGCTVSFIRSSARLVVRAPTGGVIKYHVIRRADAMRGITGPVRLVLFVDHEMPIAWRQLQQIEQYARMINNVTANKSEVD